MGSCVISKPYFLIDRYVDGKLWDDPEAQKLLSACLQIAQTEAASLEGATAGPALDAQLFYQKAAALLEEIKAEGLARQP